MRFAKLAARLALLLPFVFAVAGTSSRASGALFGGPITYTHTFFDAQTGDAAPTRPLGPAIGNGGRFSNGGNFFWDVDQNNPGGGRADNYATEGYERPMDQQYGMTTDSGGHSRFAMGAPSSGSNYYEYLDIVSASAAILDDFLYVRIDLFGLYKENNSGARTLTGLEDFYGFRIGVNAAAGAESRSGFLVRTQTPSSGAVTSSNPAGAKNAAVDVWGLNPTNNVFKDNNNAQGIPSAAGDVGGVAINKSKETDPGEVAGDGYDLPVVADGKGKGVAGVPDGAAVLYTRLALDTTAENAYLTGSPTDYSIIEFALDYGALGLTKAQLEGPNMFLLFESNHTLGESVYFWNDQWNYGEAGTPNFDERGLAGPNSSFQTDGLQNIYRLDTLRGGLLSPEQAQEPIPEPTSLMLFGGVLGCCLAFRRLTRS